MPSFDDLLAQNVATGLARQLALADLLEDRGWQLDLGTGTVTFGDDLRYPVQLLGTESHGDGTWLWAWANSGSDLDPALLRLAERLRELGRTQGVAELTERSFPLDHVDGHRLALVASGLTGRAYYRGPYDGGALFFHLEDLPAQVQGPAAPERVFTVLGQAVQGFAVDHRTLVVSFLRQQGWTVEEDPAGVSGRHGGGSHMDVAFDDLGRITGITGSVGPA